MPRRFRPHRPRQQG